KSMAISTLGDAGTNARAAIPALIAALDGKDWTAYARVPQALRKIGAPDDSFMPKLRAQLKSPEALKRPRAAAAILGIKPPAAEAMAVSIQLIKSESPYMNNAIFWLGKCGPDAKEAAPALRTATRNDRLEVRQAARQALRQIEAKEPPK